MLTYQDVIALCGLNHWEVDAIAEHEHVPPIVAAELGNYLCQTTTGEHCVYDIIVDDIAKAKAQGDEHHLAVLRAVLQHFLATHPRRQERGTAADRGKGPPPPPHFVPRK